MVLSWLGERFAPVAEPAPVVMGSPTETREATTAVGGRGDVDEAPSSPPGDGAIAPSLRPRENLTGCVVDADTDEPVKTFVVADGSFRRRVGAGAQTFTTGTDGCFAFSVPAETADVWAEAVGELVESRAFNVKLPARVVLRMRRYFVMSVELPNSSAGHLSVTHRFGVSMADCLPRAGAGECRVKVPSGPYVITAMGFRGKQLMFARSEGNAAAADSSLVLELRRAPPLTGLVRTAAGAPLPNVPLRFMTRGLGVEPREIARTRTREDGLFSVVPSLPSGSKYERFPSWQITSEGPWRISTTTVSVGDAPVQLTAELVTTPPDAQRQ